MPFCHETRWAVSPSLKYYAIAIPSVAKSSSTGFELLIVSDKGDTISRSRHALGPSPISNRTRDSAIAVLRARNRDPKLVDAIVSKGLVPRTFPPISEISVSDGGDVWITTKSGAVGGRGLMVISRTGRALGYTHLPQTTSVRWAGQSEAVVVEETEDGLQDVVLYRVQARRK